jgi:3-hydroxyacyl-[acyl-carrier-protein] dehydratase
MSVKRLETKPLGFTELRKWLRHRHPMVLLDRVLDHEPGQFIQALLSVSGNLDCVAGHFPERAIYPGTNLIQAFTQCGIILFQMSTTPLSDDELTLVGSIETRFFKIVVPGDQVVFDVQANRIVDNVFYFAGKATVANERVAAFKANLVRLKVEEMGSPLW